MLPSKRPRKHIWSAPCREEFGHPQDELSKKTITVADIDNSNIIHDPNFPRIGGAIFRDTHIVRVEE